ncbi:YciI family protein [Garicola koreensis]|uniref:YCII-related domain-containing protein n=1 Tax=Garicola koreensis TaxID=1262554 RepID=A0A7W5Y0S9_9MICC|nr:YciI family protein [Garicola koreensis]MBB3667508.1 hypothetical protein [Garicola koreensis]
MSTTPFTATHLLIHRYVPGTGPQEGTAELDAEMQIWVELDREYRESGVLLGSYALQNAAVAFGQRFGQHEDIVFAVHALAVASQREAERIAERMPHLGYGSTEVRPLMDVDLE